MREVRLRFSKTGTAKYISHLDINRCFQRAFARAGISLWFTEGFNPHPYMSFSLPLSLGVESLCESLDIRITDAMSDEEIKERMNAVLPDGIRIAAVYEDFLDPGEIAFSDYVFKLEFRDNEEALKRLSALLEAPEILAEKKAKQGKKRIMKETDIKQFIVKHAVSLRDNQIVLNVRLLAGPKRNLNPTLLFDTLIRLMDTDYEFREIARLRLLTADGTEYR